MADKFKPQVKQVDLVRDEPITLSVFGSEFELRESIYAPYERVADLCEDMNIALLKVESGDLLADLLTSIELVRLKVSAILTKVKEDEDIKASVLAFEEDRLNG